jgi:hypothetical protein
VNLFLSICRRRQTHLSPTHCETEPLHYQNARPNFYHATPLTSNYYLAIIHLKTHSLSCTHLTANIIQTCRLQLRPSDANLRPLKYAISRPFPRSSSFVAITLIETGASKQGWSSTCVSSESCLCLLSSIFCCSFTSYNYGKRNEQARGVCRWVTVPSRSDAMCAQP